MTIETGRTDATEASDQPGQQVRQLSFAQEQLWFLDHLTPGETTYNIVMAFRLHGPVRVDLLQRCLDLLVARHEALRVSIRVSDDTPYQVVAPAASVPLSVLDLREVPADEREQRVQAEIDRQLATPYDLEAGPLCRFQLLRLAEDEYLFCEGFHHIITDGWSTAVLNSELTTAYRSLYSGTEPVFEDRELDYTDFAEEQRNRLQGPVLAEELAFWQERLADLPVLELPSDRPRPVGGSRHGETLIQDLPEDLRGLVQRLADDHGASMFMVFAAAFNLVLSRYSGLTDIPVGVPMLGRPEPELEAVVGMFINMVVLRSDLSGDPTFGELLERVADLNLDLYEHQEVPFHQVVDAVQPVRDPDRNPLFQVGMQILSGSNSGENLSFPEVRTEVIPLASLGSRFDMALTVVDTGTALRATVEYSSDMFDRWRIEAMVGHLESVLRTAAADPGRRLSEIPIVTDAEAAELLAVGRGEEVPYDERPLHVQVADVARRQPDGVAVVCNGVELTYRELDRRADLLARYLRAKGLRRDQVVAVVIDRSLDAYVIMLGILKAGGTFSMLDPKHPANRLDFMITDTEAPLVISRAGLLDRLPPSTGWQTIEIDTEWPAIEAVEVDGPLEDWATSDTLAYILYTSGSTGQPKGVMITHRSVSFFCEAYRRSFDIGPADRMLQLPALSFDMSQGELWTALLHGATVVAVSPEEQSSPEHLATLLREQRVTYAGLPPAIQSVIDADAYPDLKYVMGGAEVLPPELVNKWNLPGRLYLNLYGPTEAAIACTEYVCPHIDWQVSPPIGRPHVNRQVYVVDSSFNLVPRGVAGELLIGGDQAGLAEGYLKQPELTAEKFVPDPFHPGRLVYRSGDLVRWNADLQIEFLGRVDNQVKLRGLRIELGEIEAALVSHPDVGRSVVLVRPDPQGEKRLIGYVTPAGDRQPVPSELRAHLATSLPDYMIPTAWVVMEKFPLIADWKINRKALPDPVEDTDAGDGYVEPSTPTERSVADIFGEVLSRPQVGAEDSFFEIGGNSLQAMRAVSRINKGFGIKISIRTLYGNATVRAVSAAVDEKVGGTSA